VSISVVIPGWSEIELTQLTLDLNGTVTVDGLLIDGVEERIAKLRERVRVYLASSDTMGTARSVASTLDCELIKVGPPDEAELKAELVRSLGPSTTVAIGNGANDAGMLTVAAIGVCVIGPEGAASSAIAAADIVVMDPLSGLDLLLDPVRLAATLRR
jgi:P-type E1-E2 ATPase